MRLALVPALTLLLLVPVAAEELEFDFQDPKRVNSVSFILDSTFEPIMGVASGISGTVVFDPSSPKKLHGKIVVEAKTIFIQNQRMTEVLHGEKWLDVAKHPTLEFEVTKVTKMKASSKDKSYTFNAVGKFTLHGVTREMTIPVSARYHPDGLGQRLNRMKGDLLVLRSTFTLKRTDFGINVDYNQDVVADEIEVRLAIVGQHVKS